MIGYYRLVLLEMVKLERFKSVVSEGINHIWVVPKGRELIRAIRIHKPMG